MPTGTSPRLDHMYVTMQSHSPSAAWLSYGISPASANPRHMVPQRRWLPDCQMVPLQCRSPGMVPFQCRPPDHHHGTTAATTTWLSHGTMTASITWLSSQHHCSNDHLTVTWAPLQRRPPGCHHGTTPVWITWLASQCHCYTSSDLSTLPHDGDHRRSRDLSHSGRAPICRPCLMCLWDGAPQHVAVFVEFCGCVWEMRSSNDEEVMMLKSFIGA